MLQTKYITLDEFRQYSPEIDLVKELGTKENALAFLYKREVRLASFINAKFNKNIDMLYPCFTDYQKEHYKLALLEQCIYVHRNGELSTDSGYDIDEGEKCNLGNLQSKVVAPNAKN